MGWPPIADSKARLFAPRLASMVDEVGPALKSMRLRYAGLCRQCQVPIAAGTTASYDRGSKSVVCVACLSLTSVLPEAETTNVPIDSGTAGASAQREYDRRKNKRETRIREAHPLVGGLILALSEDPQSTKAWSTGARGEELLGRRLDGLAGDGVAVLHDRRIPPTRANIDHIVVCPSGVFVIDAKKYRERPTLRVEGGIIRPRAETLMIGSRPSMKLVQGVHKQMVVVRSALESAGLDHVPVSGMLCFVEADWPMIGGDFVIDGVSVLWPRKAASVVTAPGSLDAAMRERIHRALASKFPPA